MSIEYVTLVEAKDHLRVTHNTDDKDIELKIRAASAVVKNHMGEFSVYQPARDTDEDFTVDSNYEPVLDSPLVVRDEVKAAVLIMVQKFYDQEFNFDDGKLPPEVRALLCPIRDPALR